MCKYFQIIPNKFFFYLGTLGRRLLTQAWILTQAAVSSWLLRARWVRKNVLVGDDRPATNRGYWYLQS